LFQKGKRWKSASFLVVFLDTPLAEQQKKIAWAVIASKKNVHKHSVVRNRAKRRLRALVCHLGQLSESLPQNFAILANRTTATEPWANLVIQAELFLNQWRAMPHSPNIHTKGRST
jgi:ribonuclease P protein component